MRREHPATDGARDHAGEIEDAQTGERTFAFDDRAWGSGGDLVDRDHRECVNRDPLRVALPVGQWPQRRRTATLRGDGLDQRVGRATRDHVGDIVTGGRLAECEGVQGRGLMM